jgi:hypothetical protein
MIRLPEDPLRLDCIIRAGVVHSMAGEAYSALGLRGTDGGRKRAAPSTGARERSSTSTKTWKVYLPTCDSVRDSSGSTSRHVRNRRSSSAEFVRAFNRDKATASDRLLSRRHESTEGRNSVSESVLNAGSGNHAMRSPLGAVQMRRSSWTKPSNR